MKDPRYQDERYMILSYDEAVIFLSHDDEGNIDRIRTPKGLNHLLYDGVKKYRLSELRAAV